MRDYNNESQWANKLSKPAGAGLMEVIDAPSRSSGRQRYNVSLVTFHVLFPLYFVMSRCVRLVVVCMLTLHDFFPPPCASSIFFVLVNPFSRFFSSRLSFVLSRESCGWMKTKLDAFRTKIRPRRRGHSTVVVPP